MGALVGAGDVAGDLARMLVATADEQFDITALLGPTNRLAIEVSDPAAANNGDCPFDVRLEIVEG